MRVFVSLLAVFSFVGCQQPSSKFEQGTMGALHESPAASNNVEVAVLELFTSQGCSSCPAAEKVLATYQEKGNIIPLSYHVDYWNRLGWKDPYSSPTYSKRQYEYASALSASVYTPQLVINGQYEMVGSNALKIRNVVENKLIPGDLKIEIDSASVRDGTLNITYTISGEGNLPALNLVIAENGTETQIMAGENKGATLTGLNVVRKLERQLPATKGSQLYQTNFPPGLNAGNASVVLMLQRKDMLIVSAAQKFLRS